MTTEQAERAVADAADDRRYRWFGFALIVVVFFGFGVWAAVAPISSAANAPGTVRVESKRQTVQHLEGGIVRRILVRDGDFVERGQVVIELDDTQARAQLEVVQGQYLLTLAREARLIAQRDGLERVPYPEELIERRDDPRVREAMAVQDRIFAVRRSAFDNERALYAQQIEQLEAQLEGLESQRRAVRRLARSYAEELRGLQSLQKKGYTEKRKVRELERQVADNQGRLGELVARIAQTRSQIVETRLKMLQLEKTLQREVADELDRVQERLVQLAEQRQALRDTLRRTAIRAPRAGRVVELAVHTEGAVIGKGEKLMDIVPEGQRLVVEARVSPLDIDRVAVGQSAEIRFSAFKVREAPKIPGRVVTLSADAITDPGDPDQRPYYLAVVELTEEGRRLLEENGLTLISGMPAEVFILTGERTFLEYLTEPLTAMLERAFKED